MAEIKRLAVAQTRGDCLPGGFNGARPCQISACRWHLSHSERANPPDESCVLDVADRGGSTLDEVGDILDVTRERIRQLEMAAIRKVRRRLGVLPQWEQN